MQPFQLLNEFLISFDNFIKFLTNVFNFSAFPTLYNCLQLLQSYIPADVSSGLTWKLLKSRAFYQLVNIFLCCTVMFCESFSDFSLKCLLYFQHWNILSTIYLQTWWQLSDRLFSFKWQHGLIYLAQMERCKFKKENQPKASKQHQT